MVLITMGKAKLTLVTVANFQPYCTYVGKNSTTAKGVHISTSSFQT